nr:uncharacterized protein LOC109173747 [Ipomoea trifida]
MQDCEYFMRRSQVPAFGSWDCDDGFPIPFTQCFESARQAGLLRYSYSEDRDLYVAGDLYENDVVTPAMIVVPRRREGTQGGGRRSVQDFSRSSLRKDQTGKPISYTHLFLDLPAAGPPASG